MANACLNIYYEPVCAAEMKDLKKRLDMESFYFTNSFQFDEIDGAYQALADYLGIPAPDFTAATGTTDS